MEKVWPYLRKLWTSVEFLHTALWVLGGLGGLAVSATIFSGLVRWIQGPAYWSYAVPTFVIGAVLLASTILIFRRLIRVLQGEIANLKSDVIIHYAKYGAGEHWVDVSDFLRQEIAKGNRKIPVTNGLLNGAADPCYNTPKMLMVEYSRPAARQTKSIPEIWDSPKVFDLS